MSTKHIHKDIAFFILSKLPLKSLKRFTCVQKSWSLLFEKPYFLNMLRKEFLSKHQSLYEDTNFLLSQSEPFPNERFDHDLKDREQMNWPLPFKNTPDIQILGSFSVNGTLCIHNTSKIVLWNPAMGQYKVLPSSIRSYEKYEFCFYPQGYFYDSVQDDYKVFSACVQTEDYTNHWFYWPNKDPRFWAIYSTKSNSWRKLKGDNLPDPPLRSSVVNLNEMCHWLGRNSDMLSFDFNNEIFITSDLPSEFDILVKSKLISHLSVLNGSIAYMCEYDIETNFHIWILGEPGIKKSWTKLFIVARPINCVRYHPILSRNNEHMFFINKEGALLSFDLNTQEVREINAKGGRVHHCIVYKKNLKPLNWGNE